MYWACHDFANLGLSARQTQMKCIFGCSENREQSTPWFSLHSTSHNLRIAWDWAAFPYLMWRSAGLLLHKVLDVQPPIIAISGEKWNGEIRGEATNGRKGQNESEFIRQTSIFRSSQISFYRHGHGANTKEAVWHDLSEHPLSRNKWEEKKT